MDKAYVLTTVIIKIRKKVEIPVIHKMKHVLDHLIMNSREADINIV